MKPQLIQKLYKKSRKNLIENEEQIDNTIQAEQLIKHKLNLSKGI